MKKMQQLEKAYQKAEQQLADYQARKAEGEAVVKTAESKLATIDEQVKGKLIAGTAAEAEFETKAQLEREIATNRLLLQGLDEAIPQGESAVEQAREALADAFEESAKGWLRNEIKAYTSAFEALTGSLRRLLACHNLLRQIGRQSTYKEVVGESYSYLPSTRAFPIRGFQAGDRGKPWCSFGLSEQISQAVRAEIEKG